MKKISSVLMCFLIVSFVAYPLPSFAGGVALTDEEMDQIAAGEWVFAKNTGGPVKTNKLEVNNEAQSNLKGVSNANTVDSAVAGQYNVSNAVEGVVDIGQSNISNVTNAAVADTSSYKKTVEENTAVHEITSNQRNDVVGFSDKTTLDKSVDYKDVDSFNANYSKTDTFHLDETDTKKKTYDMDQTDTYSSSKDSQESSQGSFKSSFSDDKSFVAGESETMGTQYSSSDTFNLNKTDDEASEKHSTENESFTASLDTSESKSKTNDDSFSAEFAASDTFDLSDTDNESSTKCR